MLNTWLTIWQDVGGIVSSYTRVAGKQLHTLEVEVYLNKYN